MDSIVFVSKTVIIEVSDSNENHASYSLSSNSSSHLHRGFHKPSGELQTYKLSNKPTPIPLCFPPATASLLFQSTTSALSVPV